MDNFSEEASPDGIAIIGMAGRFPQARSCDEFWANLVAGRECLTHFEHEDLRKAGIDPHGRAGVGCRSRGVVADADQFDAALFGLSPKEAEIMDPQQRVLLEVAWEAIEHAGYDHERPPGAVGVFVGSGINTYSMFNLSSRPDVLESYGVFPTVLLNEKDFLATRLAYRLNLRGPALNVQTACSTSLVAVCNACQSLLSYECDMALAGASHIAIPQCQSRIHGEGGMISQDGHCRPFDQNATGTIFSDGVGTVVLRRVEDAIADGDHIIAVIRGYGVNNDGSNKAGFAAPSVDGQSDVIQMAHAFGDIDPNTISYIEAHGTGTRLGDPIELAALTKAFRTRTARKQFCGIGSVKSNIGHLDVAAGIAGLIKTSLALQHRKLPPTINFDTPNSEVDFPSTPFYVVDSMTEWKATGGPRRAGVSSFGIGGTNAHVVLEEAPASHTIAKADTNARSRQGSLLTISAQTPEALDEASRNLANHLEKESSQSLADVAYTLQTGRHPFAHRFALVCHERSEAIHTLRNPQRVKSTGYTTRHRNVKPVFMFPGQGSQREYMGLDLYRRENVFREAVDQCAEILEPEINLDIRDVLFPSKADASHASELLNETWITHPALFVTEYAASQLWLSWGIHPCAMIGHSLGEYTAACLANVFSLNVALRLIATRGRLIQDQPTGSMLAIMRSEDECQRFVSEVVSIAAVNGSGSCVVSGETSQIDRLVGELERESIACRRLRTSHAFHSPMMEPVVAPFQELLSQAELNPPSIPFVSNVTGNWIKDEEATSPDYWTNHLRKGVMFAKGIETILEMDGVALLEVGPGHTLTTLANQHPAAEIDQVIVASMPIPRSTYDETTGLPNVETKVVPDQTNALSALGQLWQADVPIDWDAFYQGQNRYRVPLPPYPFQKRTHWIEPAEGGTSTQTNSAPAVHNPCSTSGLPRDAFAALHDCSDSEAPSANETSLVSRQSTKDEVVDVLHDLSGIEVEVLRKPSTFLEMGFDSLFLTQLSRTISIQFDVPVTFRQLVEGLDTAAALASYLETRRPTISKSQRSNASSSPPGSEPSPLPANTSASLEQRLAEMSQQIEKLTESVQAFAARVPSAIPDLDPVVVDPVVVDPMVVPAATSNDEVQILPLTDGQREIWLASQLGQDASQTFHEAYTVTLRGDLSIPVLKDCLEQLVSRHDALRTTFLEDGTSQRIVNKAFPDFKVVECSANGSSPGIENEELVQLIKESVAEPFHLVTGPLLRFVLFRLSANEQILLINYHHIVLDGWSCGKLLSELGQLYRACVEGSTSDLGPPARYADYVKWTQSKPQLERAKVDAGYWRDIFAKQVTELELPSDHLRPASKTYVAGHHVEVLQEPLVARLREASRAHNCTLFSFLLAGFQVWLQRITQQEDLVVGIPFAGQFTIDGHQVPNGQDLVGHCVSMLPLRTTCQPDSSFEDFLTLVNTTTLNGLDHQAFTFGNLIETLKLTRDASRIPLVSTSFNLVKAHQIDFGEVQAEIMRAPKAFNYFDLTLDIIDHGNALSLDCKFNRDMYESSSVDEWTSQLTRVFEQSANDSNTRISEFELMDHDERNRLLIEFNETQTDYESSAMIHELFLRQARLTPDAVAVVFGDEKLTYSQLEIRSNRLANYLRDTLDVNPDGLIGVCLERSLDMVVALLGVLKSGAAYVPLDPAYPADRIAYILEDSGAAAILTQESLADALGPLSTRMICIDAAHQGIEASSSEFVSSHATASNLAYVIYTSGSTGKPKGVQIEHRAAVNFLTSMGQQPGLSSNDVLLAVTTVSFDIAVLELYLPLMEGATVVLASRDLAMDGKSLQEAIKKYDVSIMQATPATWRLMIKSGWNGSKSLKILCGGEPLPSDLARELLPKCRELWNMYGPTETTVWSTCSQVHDPEDIHIGKPIGNTQVYIVDEQLQPTPIGVPGELMIGGDGLARGYRGRPDLTVEKFMDSPFVLGEKIYRTGDLAKYRRDGAIDCLGRVDFQVKIRGFRIELGEIEAVLTDLAGVRQAVVVAREDGAGEQQLVAYYVVHATQPRPEVNEIRMHLREKLPEYMVPSAFCLMDTIPTTPNGKVDRNSLPKPDVSRQPTSVNTAARTPTEMSLAKIWQESLKVPVQDMNTSFFDLGGHSLLAVTMFNEIERQFGLRLPLGVLIKSPTVTALASEIDEKLGNQHDAWPSLIPMNSTKTAGPRVYLVHGAGGDVLLYQKLAKHLSHDFQVAGLQSQGIDGAAKPLTTITEMASHYVSEIRAAQPIGPYHIAGYCLGGTVAYEMARLLRQEGQEVALVALLDTYNFQEMRKPGFVSASSQRLYFHLRNLLRTPFRQWPPYFSSKFQIMRSGELRLMLRGTLPSFLTRRDGESDSVEIPILDRNQSAAFSYQPSSYAGVVTVIKPKSNYSFFPMQDMGWGQLASNLDIVELDAMPHAMLEEPSVEQLAIELAKRIRGAS